MNRRIDHIEWLSGGGGMGERIHRIKGARGRSFEGTGIGLALRIIGLSMSEAMEVGDVMRSAGADAFLSKTASSAELLEAIYGMVP